MQPLSVPLASLHPGAKINARVTGRDDGIEEMKASIRAHGLLSPLLVRYMPDNPLAYEIVAGNRRLLALRQLAEKDELPISKANGDIEIGVILIEGGDAEAHEISLAENLVRLPLHPIDQYEAFAALIDEGGLTPETVAGRFGVSEKLVKQRMALGALAPAIRKAWREGGMRDETAKAFTLCRTKKEQVEIFNRLTKSNSLYANQVHQALGVNQEASRCLAFVGEETYRKAGGKAVVDLFGDLHVLSDPALAQKLAAEKLQAECARLIGEGWGFALPAAEVSDRWKWREVKPSGKPTFSEALAAELKTLQDERDWLNAADELNDEQQERRVAVERRVEQIQAEANLAAYGERQKKKCGCLVEIERDGTLTITYGMQRPVEEPKKTKAKDKATPTRDEDERDDPAGESEDGATAAPQEEASPTHSLTNALTLALSEQRTIAACQVLIDSPNLALRALLAHFRLEWANEPGRSPLKITRDGFHALEPERTVDESEEDDGRDSIDEFTRLFEETKNLDADGLTFHLAGEIARALDLRVHNSANRHLAGDALVKALDPNAWRIAALKRFDPKAYFAGVSAALCNEAADEMGLEAKGRPKKKTELAALCADEATKREWLPKELRQ